MDRFLRVLDSSRTMLVDIIYNLSKDEILVKIDLYIHARRISSTADTKV